jgi:hypothetical protein
MSMVGCFLLVDREVIDKVLSGELRTIAAALDPVSGRGAFDELKALIRRGAARELGMLAWLA